MERLRRRDPQTAAALARLAFALLLSLALHSVVLVRVGYRSSTVEPSPIRAVIVAQPPSAGITGPPAPQRLLTRAAGQPVLPAPAGVGSDAAVPARDAVPETAKALSTPIDLKVYRADELDFYPFPLEPIVVPLAGQIDGWVRVETSVSETGQVDEAKIFDAEPAGVFEAAALEALRASRFAPARKDGHPVRCRVLIRIRFGAASAAAAS